MPLNVESLAVPLALRPAVSLTDEELMRFSSDNKGYRIERNAQGEIQIMSPVGGLGNIHEIYVATEINLWVRQTGSGRCFSSTCGFVLPDGSCLSPDAAWLPLERWNALTLAQQTSFPPLCPDFLIEIRFNSDSRKTLEAKMQLWLGNGAKLAWLIDPIAATFTIYRPGQQSETLDRPASVTAGMPVEGFTLDCQPLWQAQ